MMRPAIGKSAAITTAVTPGPSSAIPVTDAVAHPNMENDMPTERFQFASAEGHQLAAALDLAEREALAYALVAHCFTCGQDVLAAEGISVSLAAKSTSGPRIDFTGLGFS